MGLAMELITGFVTAPDTTLTAATMASGNSLTVRSAPQNANIWLLQLWADSQAAGVVRLRSPKLHDNVQGIRLRHVASEVQPLLPYRVKQKLYPQDTLILEISGSATAGDIESASFLVYYEDLPGTEARLMSPDQVMDRMVSIVCVENSLATGTAGGYSGEEAINAEFDLLKANSDYALLGYQVSAECCSVGIRGADTGNLRIGGPGSDTDKHLTRHWFENLSRDYGMPMIPVFNAANKAGILVDAVQDENGTDVIVNLIFAELASTR